MLNVLIAKLGNTEQWCACARGLIFRSMATRHADAAVIAVSTSCLRSMMYFQQHQLPDGIVQYSYCWMNDKHKPFLLPRARCCQRRQLVQPELSPSILRACSRQPKDSHQPILRYSKSRGPLQILLIMHVPLLPAAEACNGSLSCSMAFSNCVTCLTLGSFWDNLSLVETCPVIR